MPLIGFLSGGAACTLEGLADVAQPRLQALGHVDGHHHCGHHRLLAIAHRHHGLDHVAVVQLVDGGDLLAGERLLDVLAVGLAGGDPGQHRVLDVHQLLPVAIEDGDGGHPEPILLLGQVAGQRLALGLGEESVALDHAAHVAAVAQRGGLEALIVRLRHLHRLVERLLDLRLEPPFDGGGDEVGGDEEDQDARHQGQGQEGEDELGLEPGADDLLAPLEGQLDEIAEEQHQQQQEDDQVEVEEEEDDEVGGERDLGRADAHLEDGGHHEEDEDPRDDEQVPLALLLLVHRRGPGRARHHWPRTGVSRLDCTTPRPRRSSVRTMS
jgi:hypothetical protein